VQLRPELLDGDTVTDAQPESADARSHSLSLHYGRSGLRVLVERQEALTQSVEILRVTAPERGDRIDRIITAIDKDSQNIVALARIAESHEKRLENLEG
jgi:hypothetical protein